MAQIEKLDRLLAEEDPSFVAAMAELQSQGAEAASETEIDLLDLKAIAKEKPPSKKALALAWLRYFAIVAIETFESLISRIREFRSWLKKAAPLLAKWLQKKSVSLVKGAARGGKYLLHLSALSKVYLLLAMASGAASYMILKATLGGHWQPNVGSHFLNSFADEASDSFSYDPRQPQEDFSDPMLHPEHVIMLDRFFVNLKRPRGAETNPMGLFEFYIEATNQDSAVEIKDRMPEVRDVISRTLESMTYDHLVTVIGKEKLKASVRKNINDILTRGQVRHIYFKNIVLKP
jgi:flagellar FliL protein